MCYSSRTDLIYSLLKSRKTVALSIYIICCSYFAVKITTKSTNSHTTSLTRKTMPFSGIIMWNNFHLPIFRIDRERKKKSNLYNLCYIYSLFFSQMSFPITDTLLSDQKKCLKRLPCIRDFFSMIFIKNVEINDIYFSRSKSLP